MQRNHCILFFTTLILLSLFFHCAPETVADSGSDNDSQDSAVRTDSAYKVNISLAGSLQNPAWSPDGSSLVFTRFRNGYNMEPADIYIINVTTGVLKCLVSDVSCNVNLPGSVWNSTINKIIFSSSRGDADPNYDHDEIYLINDNGNPGDEVKVTQRSGLQAYEPSFSPDGDYIVFESHVAEVEGDGIIFKKDLSAAITAGFTQLTTLALSGDCRQPNWSPSGSKILFQKVISDKWDIWIMDTDGSEPEKVTTDGDNTDASFSPDSKKIVYSSDNGTLECANIYTVKISDKSQERITYYNIGYDGAPSWSPDGSKIAFESYPGDPDDSSGTTIWIIDLL